MPCPYVFDFNLARLAPSREKNFPGFGLSPRQGAKTQSFKLALNCIFSSRLTPDR